ncbi:actin-1 [Trichonephila clavipes]|nr:actin-1 [Trichonephila clavipes]
MHLKRFRFQSRDYIRQNGTAELDTNPKKGFFRCVFGSGRNVELSVCSCQVIYSQFGLAIHQNDHQARRRFVEWAPNEIAVLPDFHKRILFSDEAHFSLNGYVNKQNCRLWSEANPQVYVETPLHPEKLTVWCVLWAGGILLQNDEGHNVTVNAEVEIVRDIKESLCFISKDFLSDMKSCAKDMSPFDRTYVLPDGQVLTVGSERFRCPEVLFRPSFLNLDGPGIHSLVYADKPQTLDHLEDNIRRVIADIRPQMLEKVIENWTSRLDYIRASRGSPMPEIIFKMVPKEFGFRAHSELATPGALDFVISKQSQMIMSTLELAFSSLSFHGPLLSFNILNLYQALWYKARTHGMLPMSL